MVTLQEILGTTKFKLFSTAQLEKLQELVDANPVFAHLLPGIIGGSKNWKSDIDHFYSKYVRGLTTTTGETPANLNESDAVFIGDYKVQSVVRTDGVML